MSTNQEKKVLGMDQHDLNIFMKRYGIVFVMLGMFVILMFASPNFLKTNNLINILVSVSINGVLALFRCDGNATTR